MFVFADIAILFGLFQEVHAVAAHVAYGDARILGIAVRDLGQFLAALFVEFGQRNAQVGAVDDRVEAEIGLADRTWLSGMSVP